MSAIDELIREFSHEVEVEGRASFEYRDDLLLRVAAVYDDLEPEHPDRKWCLLFCLVVLGEVSPGDLARIYGEVDG